MRFTSVRLSMPRISLDWLEGFNGRRIVLYTLYTLVLFAVFLVANFPYNELVQRGVRELDLGPLRLSVRDTVFAWHKGVELRGVRLEGDHAAAPIVESPGVFVRPGLDGVLRGELSSLYLQGSLYGGELKATWVTGKKMTRASVQLRDLQIGRYPLLATLLEEGQLIGRVSGAVTIEDRSNNLRSAQAAGHVDVQRASLVGAKIGGVTVPDLQFDTASLKFALQGGRFEIEELHADGDDLKLSGSGQIAMRKPVPDSVLNLRVSILPGAAASEDIRILLSLLPRPKGRPDAPLVISGTLKKPRIR